MRGNHAAVRWFALGDAAGVVALTAAGHWQGRDDGICAWKHGDRVGGVLFRDVENKRQRCHHHAHFRC